ncbi:MAG: hypothetical protein AB1941_12435 [Gemmatimonadota bacterium]
MRAKRATRAVAAGVGAVLLAAAVPGAAAPAPGPPRGADAWSGSYALELRLASATRLPLLGSQRSVTTSLMLVDVERTAAGWTQRHRVCDVRVKGGAGMRMIVPDAFVRGLAVRRYPAVLAQGAQGVRYTADMGLEAIGFDPAATGGALPRQADDPGVRDSDRDGSPGATVEIRVPAAGRAKLYIVQRSHLVLSGRETGPDRIEGGVQVLLQEQRTLGADPGFFARTPRIRAEPSRSGFTLVRAPSVRSCEDLVRESPRLFGSS